MTWSTTDKTANITLSNVNATATFSSTASAGGIRSGTSQSSGKFYAEFVTTNFTGFAGYGFANSTFVLSSAAGIGGDTNSLGISQGGGGVYVNGTMTGSGIPACTAGGVLCVAIDFTNKLIWARQGAGNWNGSGTANPATGTGGIAFPAGLAAGPYFLCYTDGGTTGSSSTTLHDTAASFSQAAPSGFSPWVAGTGATITPGAGSVVATGAAVTRSAGATIAPGAGTAAAQGAAATVAAGSAVTITPGAGSAIATGAPVVRSAGATIAAGGGAVSAQGSRPTISAGALASPGAGAMTVQGARAAVSASGAVTISPGSGWVTAAGAPAGVSVGIHIPQRMPLLWHGQPLLWHGQPLTLIG